MRTTSLLSTTFLILAAGCAADAPGMGGDGGGNSGGDTGGGGDGSGTVPLSAEGMYQLHSDFDIASNMPGTAGAVVNEIIKATDDPDDPSRYILEKLADQLPNGTLKSAVQSAIPFAAGYLNDRLLEIAPDFVTKLLDVGDKFGQLAKHFGTLDTLEIAANGQAIHTITGVHFKLDQEQLDFAFADYGLTNVAVPGVAVTLDTTGKLAIADHQVPLSYGAMLRLGIDNAIIPLVDPSATNLSDVFHDMVDCHAVGQYLYEAIGFGSPSTFEAGCTSGLTVGANAIYAQVDHIDSAALTFGINGTAKGVDKNGDHKVDAIQTGKWAGTLSYAGTPAPLPPTSTFTGERM